MKTTVYSGDFCLSRTLDCGQCFRFDAVGNSGTWKGFAKGRSLTVSQQGDELTFENTSPEEYENIWKPFFALDEDYAKIDRVLCADPTLALARSFGAGIRIMRQDPWETVCSFIISQNNNIPRIKGIIGRLCAELGDKTEDGYGFPTAEKIAHAGIEALAPLRCGFRDKYIIDAAQKFASGEICAERIAEMPLDEARSELMKIKGVGPKVADCALLFGFYRLEAFPADVWIKRAMERFFPDGLPDFALQYAGIAQQYIFNYIRNNPALGA